jgi:hypothetical protein
LGIIGWSAFSDFLFGEREKVKKNPPRMWDFGDLMKVRGGMYKSWNGSFRNFYNFPNFLWVEKEGLFGMVRGR